MRLKFFIFCQKYEIPIILSSDSHGKDHVGDFTYSAEFVHQAMFPESLILNNQIPKLKFFSSDTLKAAYQVMIHNSDMLLFNVRILFFLHRDAF